MPTNKQAYVKLFFTTKNNSLYCIMPNYQSKITIHNIETSKDLKIGILGQSNILPSKQVNKNLEIDLSGVSKCELPNKIFVIKIEGVRGN